MASSALVLVWTLALSSATAQEPAETFGEELDVVEVLLQLEVTDRDGHPILGLQPEDFEITEDGEPVEVTSVAYESYRPFGGDPAELERLRAQGIDVEAEAQRRYFIVFFHDIRKTDRETRGVLSQQMRAAQGAKEWVREELGPDDFVAVLRYDFSLKLYLDFSNDRRTVVDAIDRAVQRKDPGRIWPSRIKADGPSLARHMPLGEAIVDATPTTYDALQVIGRAAAEVPGRKRLLFFSIGTGLGGGEMPLWGGNGDDAPLVATLNGADIAVYTMDLTPPRANHMLAPVLHELAADTGGRYYHHIDHFHKPLRRVTQQLHGYYLVSFRSRQPAGQRGYQRVKVEMADPGLDVQGRQGYFYGPDAEPR